MRKLARILRVSVAAGALVVGPGVAAQATELPTVPDLGSSPGLDPVPGLAQLPAPPRVPALPSVPALDLVPGLNRIPGLDPALGGNQASAVPTTTNPTVPPARTSAGRPARPATGATSSKPGTPPRPGKPSIALTSRTPGRTHAPASPRQSGRSSGTGLRPTPSRKYPRPPARTEIDPRDPSRNALATQPAKDSAEPVNGVDLSPLAGYGVVGMLATLGLVFAARQWLVSERERKALAARVDALADKLLEQSERHKAELLDIYMAVGPGLQSMAATLTEYRQFLAQQRMDREIEQARQGGARGTA
jgi:hypothetical protein